MRRLRAEHPELAIAPTVTTRPIRPGEVDGSPYFFVDDATFDRKIDQGEFLEWAVVHKRAKYGTPRAPVEAALEAGRDVLFDIDWQGTQQLSSKMPKDLVRVFILPPSHAELERRLRTRALDPEEVVHQRMAKAADEMSHWDAYDYIVVNRQFERSVAEVHAILTAERLRRERQVGLGDFVRGLREGG
jgi:guanylate kinase